MKIITASTPGTDYLNVLLISAAFWLRVAEGEDQPLSKELAKLLTSYSVGGELFCKRFKLSLRNYRAYIKALAVGDEDDEDLTDSLLEHLTDLRLAMPAVRKTREITDQDLSVLNKLRLWHRSENPSTLEFIRADIGKMEVNPAIVKYFRAETVSAKPLVAELKALVKRMTGKEGLNVPLDLVAEKRAKMPALWTKYLAVRKELTVIYKQELRNFVRDNGGKVDVAIVTKHLTAKGVPHRLPKTFTGKVDEDGALLTKSGEQLKTGTGGNVGNLDPEAKIVMNPDYSPAKDKVAGRNNNWVFKAILPTKDASGKNNEQYFYTGTKHAMNRNHKFDVVKRLIAKESKVVAAWRRDLMGKDEVKRILAAQCEIIYDTCARVGGKDNANRHGQTFGLTTLTVANVKRRGTTLVLDYAGKDSVQQRHLLKPETMHMRKVIQILNMLIEGKVRKDPLWTVDGKDFNAAKLRVYFRQVSGIADASPHKLRHLRGTRLATTELDLAGTQLAKSRKPVSQRSVDDAFKSALTNVGRILGHVKGVGTEQKTVWTTAAKNYVDVWVMIDFYERFAALGVRVPAFLTKLKGGNG